jgi:hypothetical protein|nr:MAG TPA: protein of unknown function (DUF5320) [Caudoviricetes sp.]
MPHFSRIEVAQDILRENENALYEYQQKLRKETNQNEILRIKREIKYLEEQIREISQEIKNMRNNKKY